MIRALLLALICCLGAPVSAAVKSGDEALPLSYPTLPLDGSQTALADLRGKVVYLDFWASWCGPCRLSFPQLEALRQEFGPQGFEVLAVSVDEDVDDALEFLQQVPVSYPIVWDPQGESPASWGILGMPTAYLIGRDGVINRVHQGFRKGDGARLREEIIKLLGESS
ncbi:TlpA family protein disulfide reductase [Halioglobus maricola]|uniref:TlpA family protein disulfide reductase n=1 Tax=Halioglobus maricola TaxID=2601894 RepID=A0A5P9NJZ7_9GAMM|nr:TlpA disulfide reductase family protein [Halioglobus maricola]QFU75564.1 TlpA family protein disulfide reductase [Halioglobus maricola]